MKKLLWLPALLASLVTAPAAEAGTWGSARSLEGPFGNGSPPTAPLVAVNGAGHAMYAWNATGAVRFAERFKGGAWLASKPVPGGTTGAGPVALAIGDNEVAAIAYTTAATRYDPQHLMVSLRPAGGTFGTAVEPVPGAAAGDMRLGVACDGSVTLVWADTIGVWASQLAGVPGNGPCNGTPGAGPWSAAQLLSGAQVGAGLPELAHDASGAALVVWQQGPAGLPSAIGVAWRPAGGAWQPTQLLAGSVGATTWNPKPAIDGAGHAAIGFLDGTAMAVSTRDAAGAWSAPQHVSGSQAVYYPALAMNGRGDLLAAWLNYDVAGGTGAIWQSTAPAGGVWAAPVRLSTRSENADWPSAAFAADGSVAVVAWTDDTTNTSRASVGVAGVWTRSSLGAGWWASPVPVAAGGGVAAAGWPQPVNGNPNSQRLIGRTWQ